MEGVAKKDILSKATKAKGTFAQLRRIRSSSILITNSQTRSETLIYYVPLLKEESAVPTSSIFFRPDPKRLFVTNNCQNEGIFCRPQQMFFFLNGIEMLEIRRVKCIALIGDYSES